MHKLWQPMVWTCVMLGCVNAALAIDKGDFNKLHPETAERVLMSFESQVYYIISESGDSNVTKFGDEKPAFTSLPVKQALLLFVNPAEAAEWANTVAKRTKLRYQVKASNLNRIMVAQYQTLGKPLSTDMQHPDLIIVETMQRVMPVVETLFNAETREPYVMGKPGRQFIPTFLSREDAIAFQASLKAAGLPKFDRVGQDIRSHLAFVESRIDSKTTVITFGYGAKGLIEAYLAQDKENAACTKNEDAGRKRD